MSAHGATIIWSRDGHSFADGRFSRAHVWRFDGGVEVAASASPHVVPLPLSREDAVDPEEAFVAALSSCHMLTFLAIARKKRFVVDSYEDRATGFMSKNAQGRYWVSKVELDPVIVFSGPARPDSAQIADMHRLAHNECFIANSALTEVTVRGLPPHAHS